MPEEISQKLGLDAAQALATLGQLEQRFNAFATALENAAAKLQQFNAASGNVAQGLGSIQSSANTAAAAIKQVGTAAGGALPQAQQHTQNLVVSWQTLARVIQTQILVRTMNEIRNAIGEAYEANLKFTKQISEIKAISPERTFGQIADEVRQLSDQFNQPLARVAEAQYQTISDQFVTLTERTNILTAANTLAKVSASDFAGSAQLLTGALNAYGESSDMAALRAAQFEKTIDLGRLRAGELGNALGRLQSMGHELGVSLEELDAALVSITIGGVKANEAATQIRGVMMALLKPSEDLKKAYRELGVDSGQQAVATWGLQGALDKLRGTTAGTAGEFAALLRNVRAFAGGARLTGGGVDKYQEALEAIRGTTPAGLQAKLQIFTSTDAEKLTKELNKLSNFFTKDFGEKLVHGVAQVTEAFGGADGLIAVINAFGSQLPTVGAAVTVFVGTLAAVALNAKLSQAAVAGLRGEMLQAGMMAAIGIPAAQAIGSAVGNWYSKDIENRAQAERDALRKRLADLDRETTVKVHAADNLLHTRIQLLRQETLEAAKLYQQDVENYKTAMKVEETLVKASFDRVMDTRRKLTNELFQESEKASKNAAGVPDTIAELRAEMADRQFNQVAERFNNLRSQFNAYADRAQQLSSQAARMQGTTKDANEQKLTDSVRKRSEEYAKMAVQTAKQTGDLGLQRQAEDLLDQLTNKRIASLQRYQQTQQQVAQEAEQRAHQAEAHNLELDSLRIQIEALLHKETKDAQGQYIPKSSQEILKSLQEADPLISKFVNLLQQYGQQDFAKAFMGDSRAFASMRRELERSLKSADLQQIKVAPEAIATMTVEINRLLKQNVPETEVRIRKLVGMEDALKNSQDEVFKAYENAVTKANAERGKQLAAPEAERMMSSTYQTATNRLRTLAGPADRGFWGWGNRAADSIDAARDKVQDLVATMDQLNKKDKLTANDFRDLSDQIKSIDWTTAFPITNPLMRKEAAEQLKTATDDLMQRYQRQQEAEAAVNKALDDTKTKADAVVPSIDAQTSAIKAVIPSVNALAQAYWGVADAAAAASMAAGAGGAGGEGGSQATDMGDLGGMLAASGGLIRYFRRGGFAPRGSDVIPAMLSPGEFIVNAASTRKWYSQLVAINSGLQPSYRAGGGPTTNAGIVGDVTVNVTSPGGRETAREVIQAINREIRRGTSRLN